MPQRRKVDSQMHLLPSKAEVYECYRKYANGKTNQFYNMIGITYQYIDTCINKSL